jgi:hypothetical protein
MVLSIVEMTVGNKFHVPSLAARPVITTTINLLHTPMLFLVAIERLRYQLVVVQCCTYHDNSIVVTPLVVSHNCKPLSISSISTLARVTASKIVKLTKGTTEKRDRDDNHTFITLHSLENVPSLFSCY